MSSVTTPQASDGTTTHQPCRHIPRSECTSSSAASPTAEELCKMLPTLVTYSSSSEKLRAAFSLVEPAEGQPISSLPTPLSKLDRDAVEFSKGSLSRQLSRFTSPNGKFGMAVDILGRTPQLHALPLDNWTPGASPTHGGMKTWKHAFHALLESALRDGEDMAVNISYSRIRNHFGRLGHVLDAVTTPRFVVMHPYSDDNARVSIKANTEEGIQADDDSESARRLDQDSEASSSLETETVQSSSSLSSATCNPRPRAVLSGLQDWSNCVFGDPLLAEDFTRHATAEFLRGFGVSPDSDLGSKILRGCERSRVEPPSSPRSTPASQQQWQEVVDDPEHAYIRVLLYECYHAVVDVVQHFYRPKSQSVDGEIVARRRLTSVLRRLGEVSDTSTIVDKGVASPMSSSSSSSSPPTRTTPALSPGEERVAADQPSRVGSDAQGAGQISFKTSIEGHEANDCDEEEDQAGNRQDPKRPRRPSGDSVASRPPKRAKGETPER
ncbi:uncharacterized protein B0I36DRAFT_325671 [Microdochium trichocladiopsis]|uniref:Uncharacterized protein n=1 Tax=Microdochium trichocladiopsis TaxID=1682393 RepID=A0A9P8Y4G4_9PEZI|nr:uncharacterized protein B0I36DRAFT_325671 [Microdochium trichocladiopsis]KAH7029387.1 hypothetical protein B0I36DRAFT_325671 [Microdochium trichocladiopsis]